MNLSYYPDSPGEAWPCARPAGRSRVENWTKEPEANRAQYQERKAQPEVTAVSTQALKARLETEDIVPSIERPCSQ